MHVVLLLAILTGLAYWAWWYGSGTREVTWCFLWRRLLRYFVYLPTDRQGQVYHLLLAGMQCMQAEHARNLPISSWLYFTAQNLELV